MRAYVHEHEVSFDSRRTEPVCVMRHRVVNMETTGKFIKT